MNKRTLLPPADYVDAADRLRAVHDAINPKALPQPDYVEPAPHRVGKLTAQAMRVEYESAAKAIEEMGTYLLDLQKRIDDEAHGIMAAIDEVHRLAKHFRQEGETMLERIEECTKQTQRVREICAGLVPKV